MDSCPSGLGAAVRLVVTVEAAAPVIDGHARVDERARAAVVEEARFRASAVVKREQRSWNEARAPVVHRRFGRAKRGPIGVDARGMRFEFSRARAVREQWRRKPKPKPDERQRYVETP